MRTKHTLIALPIELLYEIHLSSTSHTLPQTCKTLHATFASSPPSYRAQYLIACTESESTHIRKDAALTTIMRYPICTQDVLEAYFRRRDPREMRMMVPDLPRRLFRVLVSRASRLGFPSDRGSSRSSLSTSVPVDAAGWSDADPPLPFLRYLYTHPHLRAPNANVHAGYALTRAVKVGFIPLVRFLLDHGATPTWKSNLSVLIAIHRMDLGLVRMLVERMDAGTSCSSSGKKGTGKRRKLEDRVEVTSQMLRTAVKYKAHDIVEYLTREKGCIPDMQTLLLMR